MKRKFLLLLCVVALTLSLVACNKDDDTHEHDFAAATCTAPKTCACGATEGEALGHTFAPATCTAPKTCSCGATEGAALGHTFAPATCTAPKTCACGATEGAALGHTFAPATCTAPKTCSCGATEGAALGHTFVDGTCACGAADPDYVPHTHSFAPATCTAPKTCSCGATEGDPLPHDYAPATCTAPKTCACGATEGDPLPHTYVDDKCECGAIDPNHTHTYTSGICGICGAPNFAYSEAMTPPAAPTQAFLEGTWYGEETGDPTHADADANYEGKHTFVITLGADGKGTVKHSLRGTLTVYSCVINGNTVSIYTTIGGIHLVYNSDTGYFTLRTEQSTDVNFTKGTELQMLKVDGKDNDPHACEHACATCGKCTDADCTDAACADKCTGHSSSTTPPATLTKEYLEGTWTGEETDFWGSKYTFTVTINPGAKDGTVNHSQHGEFRIVGITFITDNTIMLDLKSAPVDMVTLEYNNGTFTLSGGKNFSSGTVFTMSKPAPAPAHECEHACATCGKCTDTDCTEDACADKCQGHAPAEITREYLAGTWYGTETGAFDYVGNHTFVIVIDEFGKSGTVTHSLHGEFKITGITIYDTDWMMMDLSGLGHAYMISLHYENGVFTLNDGKNFSYGSDDFTMSKTAPAPAPAPAHECESVCDECEKCTDADCTEDACAEKCQGHAPAHECEHACATCGKCTDADCAEDACADKCQGHTPAAPDTLTDEYLVGTWTGTEGEYNITMTFDANGNITMTHSAFGSVEVYDYFLDGNSIMIMCSTENSSVSLNYANGTFTLPEGAKGFAWGKELTMTKGEPAAPAHECESACDECEKCTDADCTEDACAEKCEGHAPAAPETLTEEYLVGTWTGAEGDYDITMTFDANGDLTVTHSYYGGAIAVYDYYLEGNSIMILCGAENSSIALEYANGSLSLLEGAKGFVWGTELTMTKTA